MSEEPKTGTVDVQGDVYLQWHYPEIYDREKQNTVTLSMYHVRADDPLRIKYDSERDGWVIEQKTWLNHGDGPGLGYEDLEEWREVAFVQSWSQTTDCECCPREIKA